MTRASIRSPLALLATLALAAGCATVDRRPAADVGPPTVATATPRPLPRAVEPPPDFRRAIERGTRTMDGTPGSAYWQQWTDYDLEARLSPAERRLDGTARIRYRNRSPDTLDRLHLNLIQNVHAPGVVRNEPAEVTGGIALERVVLDGVPLDSLPATTPGGRPPAGPGWSVDGTLMTIVPPSPVRPDAAVEIEIDYGFPIPQRGAGGRMGYSGEDLLFLAYWYPIMAVYDDVVGWSTDPFLGNAEFYAGFGSYDITIEAPSDWLVVATGELQNPGTTLSDTVAARLHAAAVSDEVVRIVTPENLGRLATWEGAGETIRWVFAADSVHDVAFTATRASNWDANRTPVGDLDGDGRTDYALVNALYRASAERWRHVARYMTHSISFLSDFLGLPYPWPHMTAVEGGGIIGGGMEFPMMTLMGDYATRGDSALYYVTAHELGHMWIPMIVSNNERRYAWMDEGLTSFDENVARMDFFPGVDHHAADRDGYLSIAGTGREGEILRWSDYHYSTDAYRVASYNKPATVLVALREVLGEEPFMEAYRAFFDRWAYRHPYPWDFFRTFEDVTGRDLDWFWASWFAETWVLDHAVEVVGADGEARIVVEDLGRVPMPFRLAVRCADGSTERIVQESVDPWLEGRSRVEVDPPCTPTGVRLDPEGAYPDVDRSNDVWPRETGGGR